MKAAIAPVKNLAGSIGNAGASLLKFTGIGAAVAAGFQAFSHLGDGFKLAADLEKTQVQFAALIGDSGKAKTAIADLTSFAKQTPFELPTLIDASRELLASGVTSDKLLPSLKAIGDVAAGVGQPLDEVTQIFGRVAEEGNVSERSLRQFAKAGIPVIAELAKQFGTTKDSIKGLAEKGQISFGQLQKAFASMTGPGGKFAGQMEKQANSLGGLWTRLSGAVEEGLGSVAQTIANAFNLKEGIRVLISGLTAAGQYVTRFISYIAPIAMRIGTTIYHGFESIYGYVVPVLIRTYEILRNIFNRFTPVVIAAGVSVYNATVNVFNSVYNFIAPVATRIYQSIANNWRLILSSVTTASLSVWNVVSSVWGVIADFARSLWNGIVRIWEWGSKLIVGHTVTIGTVVTSTWQWIGSAAKWLSEKISLSFNVAAYAIEHWRDGVKIIGLQAAGFFTDIGDRAKYVFVDVIPYTLEYLYRNWKQILTDIITINIVTWTNITANVINAVKYVWGFLKNINWGGIWNGLKSAVVSTITGVVNFAVNSFKAVWNYFKSIDWRGSWKPFHAASAEALTKIEGEFHESAKGFKWTPLTEGFKSSVKESFKLPEFKTSDLTKNLKGEAAKLEKSYGTGLGKFLSEKEEQSKTILNGIKKIGNGIVDTFNEVTTITPKIEKPIIPTPDMPKIIPQLTPDSLTLGITPEIKRAKALRVGSAEAQLARYGFPKLAIPGLSDKLAAGTKAGSAQAQAAQFKPTPPPWKQDSEAKAQTAKDQLSVEKDSNFYIRMLATQSVNIQPAVFS